MKIADKTNGSGATAASKRFQWEYRQKTMDLDDADLTQYGAEGWECYSVVPIPMDPSRAVFYFKRRI